MQSENYLKSILQISDNQSSNFQDFIKETNALQITEEIISKFEYLKEIWKKKKKKGDIERQHITIPNAKIGKQYQAKLDFNELHWEDFFWFEIIGLESFGLHFNNQTHHITGVPNDSGEASFQIKFKLHEADEVNSKKINFYINPDPKTLFKNNPSDTSDEFWKEDNKNFCKKIEDKSLIISSKRGRSHAHNDGFREDDFLYNEIQDTQWHLICISDGAGSAKFSRKGSALVVEKTNTYFKQQSSVESLKKIDNLIDNLSENVDEIHEISQNFLLECAAFVHDEIKEFAISKNSTIKDFHATQAFVLVKKHQKGYAILSFGIGDCPINVLYDESDKVILLNDLDIGEYSGGTWFVTSEEIFKNRYTIKNRAKFSFFNDFQYLFLMTDGIYDPKFSVENQLNNIQKWKDLLVDLQGENEDKVKVDFSLPIEDTLNKLDQWMDFWSPGNHDDRTVAIIY